MGVGNPLQQLQKLLRVIWGKWDIQTIVVGSLLFQCLLVVLGPMRKTSKSNITLLIIWIIYLNAEYFATFAIGLINSTDTSSTSFHITAFWAAFLLLHLGGPHTITSFSTEDNDLWHRHMLTLVVQVFSVLLVLYRSQIYKDHALLLPTLIVFVLGVVKYAERTRSLYLASLPIMRRSMRQENLGEQTIDNDNETEQNLEAGVTEKDELEIIYRGYKYYKMYRGFIVDHTFINIDKRDDVARKYFQKLSEEEAFKVMEVELNFMYDAMFTKMVAVQWISWFGYLYRFVLHISLVVVTVMFFYRNKRSIHIRDTSITYILLGGAVVLDFIGLLKLIFSEWTIAIMMGAAEEERMNKNNDNNNEQQIYLTIPRVMINFVKKKILWLKMNQNIIKIVHVVKKRISGKKRWSRMMKHYSLLNHSLNSRWEWVDKILDYFGLTEKIDSCQHTKVETVENNLTKKVFEYIKKKSTEAEPEISIQPTNTEHGYEERRGDDKDGLKSELHKICSTIDELHQYDISVLILHVATEICYFTMEKKEGDDNPEICKNISEYLAYLLVVEGKITSAVPGNVGMRFRDICWEEVEDTREELNIRLHSKQPYYFDYMKYMLESTWEDVKNLFTNKKAAGTSNRVPTMREIHIKRWEERKRKRASEGLLWEVGNEDGQTASKSKLSVAVRLARDLKRCSDRHVSNTDDEDGENCSKEVWKFLSERWVKLLLYAGSHCRGDAHYLNKGGELLTFVRLLMAHFGLRESFKDDAQINQRNMTPTSNNSF